MSRSDRFINPLNSNARDRDTCSGDLPDDPTPDED